MSKHWNGHGWSMVGKDGLEGSIGSGAERVPTASPDMPSARATQAGKEAPNTTTSVTSSYENWQSNGGQGDQVLHADQRGSAFGAAPRKSDKPYRTGRKTPPREPVTRGEKEKARAKRRHEREKDRASQSRERKKAQAKRSHKRARARKQRRGTGLLSRLFGR